MSLVDHPGSIPQEGGGLECPATKTKISSTERNKRLNPFRTPQYRRLELHPRFSEIYFCVQCGILFPGEKKTDGHFPSEKKQGQVASIMNGVSFLTPSHPRGGVQRKFFSQHEELDVSSEARIRRHSTTTPDHHLCALRSSKTK